MQYTEVYFEVCVPFIQPSGLKFQLVLWASSSDFLLTYILLEDDLHGPARIPLVPNY